MGMANLKKLFIGFTLSCAVLGQKCSGSHARAYPPHNAIVVDQSGAYSGTSYPTMSEGVAALNTTTTANQFIFVYPGSYVEQTYIPPLSGNLTIQGYTCDSRSYEGNTATLTYNLALINTTSDDKTATLRLWTKNVKLYNIDIANTFGHISSNGQNLAISAYVANQGFYGCKFLSYQDTILAETGTQLYVKCLVQGAVDFIFGQTALAWFDRCDIRTINAGCVTASGRSADTNPSWYVLNRCNVDRNPNYTVADGANYLGRPWGDYARVVVQESYLGSIINAAGWSQWSTSDPNIDNVYFGEYNNYGPGSASEEGPRANFSMQLTAPVNITTVLGDNYLSEWWVDASYLW
ncbi:pectin lyase fold/virulence factor [Xylariales sp. PMI_506]|nr:pectin lyase fold/virulence factor [Xylariales sp. PMI_506]